MFLTNKADRYSGTEYRDIQRKPPGDKDILEVMVMVGVHQINSEVLNISQAPAELSGGQFHHKHGERGSVDGSAGYALTQKA